MGRGRRPRLAIAVEPAVLGDSLAVVLEGTGVDEVVNLRAEPGPPGTFDAAIATVLPDHVRADVVIRLPDEHDPEGWVEVGGERVPVALGDVLSVLRVLDRYCPGDRAREVPAREWPSRGSGTPPARPRTR